MRLIEVTQAQTQRKTAARRCGLTLGVTVLSATAKL